MTGGAKREKRLKNDDYILVVADASPQAARYLEVPRFFCGKMIKSC